MDTGRAYALANANAHAFMHIHTKRTHMLHCDEINTSQKHM